MVLLGAGRALLSHVMLRDLPTDVFFIVAVILGFVGGTVQK
jgi:hypothetical protein